MVQYFLLHNTVYVLSITADNTYTKVQLSVQDSISIKEYKTNKTCIDDIDISVNLFSTKPFLALILWTWNLGHHYETPIRIIHHNDYNQFSKAQLISTKFMFHMLQPPKEKMGNRKCHNLWPNMSYWISMV